MISVKDAGYDYGNREIFSGVDFNINPSEKVGVVGPNGSGKTTLLKIISGELEPTSGSIAAPNAEIGYMPQQLNSWVEHRVSDFLGEVTGVKTAGEDYESSLKQLAEQGANDKTLLIYENALERATNLGALDSSSFENRMRSALRQAGIGDIDIDSYIGELSGGQRTKLAMAATFASKHDVVLLDEPTNNLDAEGIVVLERHIKNSKASFVIVSHDRRFLRNSVSTIIELLGGDKGIQSYGMGYDEFAKASADARTAAIRHHQEYETELDRLRNVARIASQGASGNQNFRPSSDNDKIGHNARAQKGQATAARKVRSAASRLEDFEAGRPELPTDTKVSFDIDSSGESDRSKHPLVVENLVLQYPGSAEQFGPYNLTLSRGERVLLAGANGSGKSTLLRSLVNRPELVKSGSISVTKNEKIGYMDQEHSLPNAKGDGAANIMELQPGISRTDATHLLVKFNAINKDELKQPVEQMSPGQRAKILLAAISYGQPELLILDEPTNHLDIPTIEAMERALQNYPGTILIASHDREFLESIGVQKEYSIS